MAEREDWVVELKAWAQEARKQRGDMVVLNCEAADDISDEIARLRAENGRLREALKDTASRAHAVLAKS